MSSHTYTCFHASANKIGQPVINIYMVKHLKMVVSSFRGIDLPTKSASRACAHDPKFHNTNLFRLTAR